MFDTAAPDIAARWKFALDLARAAGRHTLKYFGQSFSVERKSDASPVTIADREAEQLARQQIAAAFPEDAILGEEFGEVPGSSGFRWIIDPIDGTKSFISGVPLYSTLLGVERDGQSLIGVIYMPALDEGVHAARGGGAWHFRGDALGEPARVSDKRMLGEGLFVNSQVDSFNKRGASEVYRELEKLAYVTRTWGDGYGYFLVAVGRAEVMVDPLMNVWDAAAIAPVIDEAGGKFSDWQGVPTIYAGEGLATNGLVRGEVLGITSKAKRLS